MQTEPMEADGYESEAYKNVLAAVRQNIVFQRALQSMREGNTVRQAAFQVLPFLRGIAML